MKRIFLLSATCMFLYSLHIVHAQPNMTLKRVTVNWPTIELYFSTTCDGSMVFNMTKQDFTIYEDGIEVKDFTFWCPDPSARCAISVALVCDVSGSMGWGSPSPLAGMKAAVPDFIDLMDGHTDEAAVIMFNSQVNVYQTMTTVKPMLYAAVDSLFASGGTAVWDGAYAGVIELINNGVNQCRAVIVMTDGEDNSSTRTVAEVIALANRHRIRIFTIGLPNPSINATELELMAQLTGGKYYQTPNPSEIAAIYIEISTVIFQWFQECLITYERECADGMLHTVDLQLSNFCGASDLKSGAYRAALDSTTFTQVAIQVGQVTATGNVDVAVPLTLVDPIQNQRFYSGVFDVLFDESCMQFTEVRTSGCLLASVAVSTTSIPGGVRIETTNNVMLSGPGTLLDLIFRTNKVPDVELIRCPVTIRNWIFSRGCLLPVCDDGYVEIDMSIYPIDVMGPVSFCEGDSVTLRSPAELSQHVWSTGETTSDIIVKQSGYFHFTAYDASRNILVASDTVRVTVWPRPIPVLQTTGTYTICEGDSLTLATTASFNDYLWSTGARSRSIVVRESGTYFVTVTDGNGCVGTSQPLSVQRVSKPSPVVSVLGATTICLGDSVVLDAGAGYAAYLWKNGEQTRYVTAKTPGEYMVTVTDSNGCQGFSSAINVTVLPVPVASLTGDSPACIGQTATYSAMFLPNATYDWSVVGGSITDGNGTASIDVVWTTEGVGTVRLLLRSAHGCINDTSITVTTYRAPRPRIVVSGTTTICEGDSLVLDIGTGFTNLIWSTGATMQRITVWSTGLYYATVTDAHGCVGVSDSVYVTVIPNPIVTVVASGPTTFCEGDSVILDAGEGHVRYNWSNGVTNRFLTVRTQGSYSVTATDASGCTGVSSPVFVTVHALPNPVISGNRLFCDGDDITLDAGDGYTSYLWSTGEIGRSIVVTKAGRYDVLVTNSEGCEKDTFVIVEQFPPPLVPTLVLRGDTLFCDQATATGYQWFYEGVVIPGAFESKLLIDRSGRYGVRITDRNGCTAYTDIEINLASTTIALTCPPDREHEAGEIVIIPIVLSSVNLMTTDVSQLTALVRFNRSILKPMWSMASCRDEGKDRIVSITATRQPSLMQGTMLELPFRVLLGDEEATEIRIDSLAWIDGTVPANSGTVTCTIRVRVCREGGSRLFIPGTFTKLHQNHPNPFNAMTVIEYETAEHGYVEIVIYDAFGRLVATPVSSFKPAGQHSLRLDATGMQSGIYLCILKTPTTHRSIMLSVVH